jgi:hypothetical protein
MRYRENVTAPFNNPIDVSLLRATLSRLADDVKVNRTVPVNRIGLSVGGRLPADFARL